MISDSAYWDVFPSDELFGRRVLTDAFGTAVVVDCAKRRLGKVTSGPIVPKDRHDFEPLYQIVIDGEVGGSYWPLHTFLLLKV